MLDKENQISNSVESQTPANMLLDFLTIIVKYRKFITRFILICTLTTTVVAFLSPKWYKSTASVFPAEKADLLGGLEGIASFAKSFSASKALTSLGSNPELDRYKAILKSGTVLGAVIKKFDLVNVYEITSYPGEKTAKELLNNTEFTIEDEGYLTVTVYDKDPQRAADMANYFVEMLNKTNTELQIQNARGNRGFIEERYKKNLADIARAEDSLKAFQKKYGVIALPEQVEASIKTVAEITGQLAEKEVRLAVLKRTQSVDNPVLIGTQIEIEELQRKLSQINEGTAFSIKDMNIIVPFSKMPEIGGEYVRRFREMEIQYKILQFITPLYEQAKVEEVRNTPSVLVLDKASPAERKAKPKRALIILGGFLVALISSLVFAALYEKWCREREINSELYKVVSAVGYKLVSDLNKFYFKKKKSSADNA